MTSAPRPKPSAHVGRWLWSSLWMWVCAVPGAASAALWLLGQTGPQAQQWVQSLAWDATLWQQQPWTLWTAPLVHLSGMHLLANEGALIALAAMGWALRANPAAALAALLAWPLSTLSLLGWPEITRYVGLSGLNHAIALVFIAYIAIYSIAKPLSFVALALVGLKLLSEHAWDRPVQASAIWGFDVVVAAHLGGAVVGAVCGVAVCGLHGLRQFTRRGALPSV